MIRTLTLLAFTLLPLAFAQDATAQALATFFKNILNANGGGVVGLVNELIFNNLGPLVRYTNIVAWAFFFAGFSWRIYNLWLSEADPQSLLWAVLRMTIIGVFISLANYGPGGAGYPLTGDGCNERRPDVVLSYVMVCSWKEALSAGTATFLDQSRQQRLVQAITNYSEAVVAVAGMQKLADIIGILRVKIPRKGGPVQTAEQGAGTAAATTTTTKPTWFARIASALVGPFLMLLLVFPLIIYLGIVLFSGALITIAAIILPIALALMTFGLVSPVLRVVGTALGQYMTVWLLPLFFFIASVFALERPGQMLNAFADTALDLLYQTFVGTSQDTSAVNNAVVSGVQNESQKAEQDLQQTDQGQKQAWWQSLTPGAFIANIEEKIGDKLDQLFDRFLTLLSSLVFMVIFFILAVFVFMALTFVSFQVALNLLTALPSTVASMFGGTDVARMPAWPVRLK